jgi:hypothetical protein
MDPFSEAGPSFRPPPAAYQNVRPVRAPRFRPVATRQDNTEPVGPTHGIKTTVLPPLAAHSHDDTGPAKPLFGDKQTSPGPSVADGQEQGA